jgi:hypothetical protein
MARLLERVCPDCTGYLAVVVKDRLRKSREVFVDGICTSCRYRVSWKLIFGGRHRKRGVSSSHAQSFALDLGDAMAKLDKKAPATMEELASAVLLRLTHWRSY